MYVTCSMLIALDNAVTSLTLKQNISNHYIIIYSLFLFVQELIHGALIYSWIAKAWSAIPAGMNEFYFEMWHYEQFRWFRRGYGLQFDRGQYK